jgi:hypothetical protein
MGDPLSAFTEAQQRQLHILAVKGFTLTIVNRQPPKLQLGVAGRDPSGARIVGSIDARGRFVGELLDYAPSKVAVGAPPEHVTVEEAIG